MTAQNQYISPGGQCTSEPLAPMPLTLAHDAAVRNQQGGTGPPTTCKAYVTFGWLVSEERNRGKS